MRMYHKLNFRAKSFLSDLIGYRFFYSSPLGKLFPNDAKVFYELTSQFEPLNLQQENDFVKFNTMFLATMMVQSQ